MQRVLLLVTDSWATFLTPIILILLNKKIKKNSEIIDFLKLNALQISDIDAVVLGYNGDIETDVFYKNIAENCFKNTQQVYYKHLSGEYNTASAFGLWVGAKIVKTQQIPEIIKVNHLEKTDYKTILLYNQYKGIDHSFTLISKC